jgi:hypothetical protein
LILPISHEHFLLIPGFFSLETKKCLHRHPVMGVYIDFMKIGQPKLSERIKEVGCLVRLQVHNSRMIWELMITDGNVEGIEAELFLTCILLIKGK